VQAKASPQTAAATLLYALLPVLAKYDGRESKINLWNLYDTQEEYMVMYKRHY